MKPPVSKEKISLNVASEILDLVRNNPDSRLGLPTGRTPEAMYQHLIKMSQEKEVDWSKVKFFGLDEYLNTAKHKTFKFYLEENFFNPLKIKAASCFNPLEIEDYDAFIKHEGGLDLTVLGIGQNGHIAFNEPPSIKHTWTHCIELAQSTREANKVFFKDIGNVPKRAVTMGIETLLSSKRIILMAFGDSKKEILIDALDGKISEDNPASFLQLHQNLSVFTDFEYR